MSHRIGIISDTHGLLRPEAVKALSGVERILHAGDVGKPDILKTLNNTAPVTAVRGNVDFGPGLADLPETQLIQIGDVYLYMIHNVDTLDLDPSTAGFHAVIYGHSHRPETFVKKDVLYLNPGSIGPRRFNLPVALAILHINGTNLRVDPLELDV